MNSKRSYLDILNTGRQRRTHTSLEDLNRTLESLESRIGRTPPPERNEPREDISRRMQRLAGAAAWPGSSAYDEPARQPDPSRPFRSLARDIENARQQEESLAAVGRIAGELRDLREELRHQMTAGLRREFDALRRDIERAYEAAVAGTHGAELALELERLSGAIRSLAERSDDQGIGMLREEMDQVRQALDSLAREETVRSVGSRWDDFDRRWRAAEERRAVPDPAIEALNSRLEQINAAVNNLPESLSLRSLEEKVRMLAGAVDQFSRHQEQAAPAAFDMIEERLDEISRAIVASAAAQPVAAFDPQPFERIEARITSLARQLEEFADDRSSQALAEGLATLSERVDDIARRAELPETIVRKLTAQIEAIAGKLDESVTAPGADRVLQGFEERFSNLSTMLERRQNDAAEQGHALFRDLERRLEDLATHIDRRREEGSPAEAAIMDAIDARFAELASRLDTPSDDSAIRDLEARLEDISSRLDQSARQVANFDPDLIRNLEAQVAGLSRHLSQPSAPLPELEEIGPRLDHLERSIAESRDAILSAAREAAEETIRNFSGSAADEAAVVALAGDLKSLESLARRSDERNTKTFEAIHDTLLKIVDRLGALETREYQRPSPVVEEEGGSRPGKLTLDNPPPMQADEAEATLEHDAELDDFDREFAAAPQRSPAEAAAAAALAAVSADAGRKTDPAAVRKSMFGGLARAFSGKRKSDEPVALAGDVTEGNLALAPEIDLDEPLDPAIANRPLEPGSGAPDLQAIMRRVRDERAQPEKSGDADVAKSDFIAAARRAAQAAAAEAEILKKNADRKSGTKGKFSFGDLLRARRKPLLVAAGAIMIALAGLQLGKAFMAEAEIAGAGESGPVAAEDAIEKEAIAENVAVEEEAAGEDVAEEAEMAAPDAGPQAGAAPADSEMDAPAEAKAAAPSDTVESSVAAEPEEAEPFVPESAPLEPESETAQSKAATAAMEPIPTDAGPVVLREAAAAGDAKALFEIGARYAEGRGVAEDLTAAAKWFEKSADLGFAPAQYRIGSLYEKGLGVERDIAKAKTWYQMAATQGNAAAMHNLAVLFAMGADGAPDNDSAARWFLEAAERDVKDSQFNLGILAAKGAGMPQNLEESYKWFALVAKSGDNDAAEKRDEIAKALTSAQLEKARAAVELWKPKPLDPEANVVDIPESWQDGEETTAAVDMKQAVRNIQIILARNGYDAGTPDGIMGQKTRNAIAAFQEANGMLATGEVDENLVQALLKKK